MRRALQHVDHTIRKIASARGDRYELVVLSDHGQVDTIPFAGTRGRPLGEVLAGLLPGFRVQEMKGKAYGVPDDEAKGRVNVTLSGGLAHLYFTERRDRLGYRDLMAVHPQLVRGLAGLEQIAVLMARDGEADVFWKAGQELPGPATKAMLAGYDEPDILLRQLSRLNSFKAAGDIILFGAFIGGKQVNFENQAGGHGAIGGEQLHPFLLAKREWGVDTSLVEGAHELHPILSRLRDDLIGVGPLLRPIT